jgi:hypothetical protein
MIYLSIVSKNDAKNDVLYVDYGGFMRKLVLILIAFIAAATFITAFDNPKNENSRDTVPARFIELRANPDLPAGR